MTAGLFVCDHVKDQYQDEFGDYPDMFARLFPELEWILYDVYNDEFPKDLNECDLYMATGSKHSVYDDIDWIHKLKGVIHQIEKQNKCFVGFCFGHQLLGEALGGKVEKSPNGWCVGVHTFAVGHKKEWMIPDQTEVNLLMMCQDQIIELPPNTEVLAGNDICPSGIIQIGNNVLGIQAHPEFTKDYDKMLMETRMNKMGDGVALEGIKSLSNSVDTEVIKSWINNFLNHAHS